MAEHQQAANDEALERMIQRAREKDRSMLGLVALCWLSDTNEGATGREVAVLLDACGVTAGASISTIAGVFPDMIKIVRVDTGGWPIYRPTAIGFSYMELLTDGASKGACVHSGTG